MPDSRAPRSSPPQDEDEVEVSAALRAMVLSTRPDELGLNADEPDRVFGVVMELGRDLDVVTVVALLDGTASRYLSTGGGTVGAGEHEPVAEAARSLVAMGQVLVGQTEPESNFPSPAPGRVRFHLLTVGGGRTADATARELDDRRHGLSPLYEVGVALTMQIDRLGDSRPD
ncbi:hypothetical protein C6I20_16715 [Aeromicrobium sp. A1-2]|uniref:hypothetical protein n=1 Tax=Aeromicrobium sp. A1-2 TaxID=2107713 RepID=UPI000E4991EC|nr:hypothetical protein [Aeromicrobium sp. A1-2]AXT86646.1 hypothetical protein C6I20_16715 [Aeromicrobium sp. A1-2]